MEKKLFYYMIAGFIFTASVGSMLHFAYEYSAQNILVGMFAPVNESTWEHMKMLFFPAFFYCLLGWPFFYNVYPAFFSSCLSGIITGTMSIAVIFYTYSGIIGQHYVILDIFTFLISVYLTFFLNYQLTIQGKKFVPIFVLVSVIVIMMTGFFAFTYSPPEISLFLEMEKE